MSDFQMQPFIRPYIPAVGDSEATVQEGLIRNFDSLMEHIIKEAERAIEVRRGPDCTDYRTMDYIDSDGVQRRGPIKPVP